MKIIALKVSAPKVKKVMEDMKKISSRDMII